MKIIGITGGIGSGKSFVMELLAKRYGITVILADEIGHELMQPKGVNYEAILEIFGQDILKIDGTIDRKKLGDIVFREQEKLQLLNHITRENIKKEIQRQILLLQDKGISILAIEGALLFEDHYEQFCDEMWFVDAKYSVRMDRLIKKRDYSKEKCEQIIRKQKDRNFFLEHCKRVIVNNGSEEEVVAQLEKIMEQFHGNFMEIT